MEFGSIEREIYVDASPDVVFEVISLPEHVREWWADDATLDPVPGGVGALVFITGPDSTATVPMTVIESVPPRLFSFRWGYDASAQPTSTNSFLVTFELAAQGSGTRVRMTETGFREQGWEVAVLEETYRDHVAGWDRFVPQLATYAAGLVAAP